MKKFFEKNWKKILVVVLLVAFALLVMFTEEKPTSNTTENPSISAWEEETSKDKSVVTVLALTTCGYCQNYKPIIEGLQEEYDFVLYWYEIDTLSETDNAVLTSKYELLNYKDSVPYTFITKNGKIVTGVTGGMEKSAALQFLKDNEVLE